MMDRNDWESEEISLAIGDAKSRADRGIVALCECGTGRWP